MDKVKQMPDEVLKEITELSLSISNYEQLSTVYGDFVKEVIRDKNLASHIRSEFEFGGKLIIISPQEIIDVVLKKRSEAKQIIEANKKTIQEIWTKAITEAGRGK